MDNTATVPVDAIRRNDRIFDTFGRAVGVADVKTAGGLVWVKTWNDPGTWRPIGYPHFTSIKKEVTPS